ncbi:MAG: hypothetical protein DHS20C09_15880 [marine bacterium B5-7]|nr:MAG: hypothetical protein DHS20C09_15880 [marine bacterium B5-7]
MKTLNSFNFFILIIISHIMIQTVYADELGRLFTSATERMALNKIRNEKPKPETVVVEVVEVENIIEPVEEKVVIRDAIVLKGLVHRSDGKNAAWINDSNTYEGDLESLYIQIKTEEIESDQVQLTMPDNETKVKIKVGDYYDPQKKDDN